MKEWEDEGECTLFRAKAIYIFALLPADNGISTGNITIFPLKLVKLFHLPRSDFDFPLLETLISFLSNK